MKKIAIIPAFAAVALFATVAYASVTFDPNTGEGFVGKGEVQEAFGWNNRALQENADGVNFRVSSDLVEERSWTCTNSRNENEQVRDRRRTTTIQGTFTSVARERNQITGFILTGYEGDPQINEGNETGNQLNSCPGGQDWSLTEPAGDWYELSRTGGLEVGFGGSWVVIE